MPERPTKPTAVFIIHGTKSPWFLGERGHKFKEWISKTFHRPKGKERSEDQFSWIYEKPNDDKKKNNAENFEFTNALKELGPIKIIPWAWSGLNREAVREEEAHKLAEKLREIQNTAVENVETDGIVLIAHSHGGNISIRALQLLESQTGVRGVICLATPFLQTLPREPGGIVWPTILGKELVNTFLNVSPALGFLIEIATIWWAGSQFLNLVPEESMVSWPNLAISFLFGLIFLARPYFQTEDDGQQIANQVLEAQKRLISEKKKDQQIKPSCLCLYSLADEAAGGLNFFKFIVSVPYLLRDRRIGFLLIIFWGVFLFFYWWNLGTWGMAPNNLSENFFMVLIGSTLITLSSYLLVLCLSIKLAGLIAKSLFTLGANAQDQYFIRTEVSLTPLFALNPEFQPLAVTEASLRHSIYKDRQVFPPIKKWWKKHCQFSESK